MPENTRVHNCVEDVKAKGGNVNPYAVCQASTGQNFHTGEALKEARMNPPLGHTSLPMPKGFEAVKNPSSVRQTPQTPAMNKYATLGRLGQQADAARRSAQGDDWAHLSRESHIDMAAHENDLTLERLANKGEAIMNNQKVHPNHPPIGDYLAPLPKVEPKTQHARVPAEPADDQEPEENEVMGEEPMSEGQAQAITKAHHGEHAIQFCPHCGGHIGMDPAVVESEPLREAAGGDIGKFYPRPQKPGHLSIGRPLGSGLGQSPQHETPGELAQRIEGGARSGLEGGGAGGGEAERRGMKPLARVDHPFGGGHR
jgi:hypothetical protein